MRPTHHVNGNTTDLMSLSFASSSRPANTILRNGSKLSHSVLTKPEANGYTRVSSIIFKSLSMKPRWRASVHVLYGPIRLPSRGNLGQNSFDLNSSMPSDCRTDFHCFSSRAHSLRLPQ